MFVSLTQNWLGALYKGLKVRHQFATWCATSLQFQFNAFQVTSISQIFASVFLSSLLHRGNRKSECSNQEIIQKFCCLGQVANWWRTLSPLYKAPNQFWVSDTNISGFVRCSDFQPSLTFSDFLWKIPSYVPIKKTAPPQRGSFFRLTFKSVGESD